MSTPPTTESFTIRPPRQRRSREAWLRILDAGLELLEGGGYEAFTIAAICERAQVAPSAVYDRADTKEGLFLAVFEHGQARIFADYHVFDDGPPWNALGLDQTIRAVVHEIGGIFRRHARFLHAIILISAAHSHVYRSGVASRRALEDRFITVINNCSARTNEPLDPQALDMTYAVIFSTLSMRIAYGPGFTSLSGDDAAFLDSLASMASAYLLRADART